MKKEMLNSDDNFFKRVYYVVSAIPKGKVASYGLVAQAAGNKKMARQVGWALHVNPDPQNTPCFRVVFADGQLSTAFAFGGINRQRELLIADGIGFDQRGRVLKEYFCDLSDLMRQATHNDENFLQDKV